MRRQRKNLSLWSSKLTEYSQTPTVSHGVIHKIALCKITNHKKQPAPVEFRANRHDLHSTNASIVLVAAEFSPLQKFQTDNGAHPASYSKGIGVLPRG
jgi:hypothetical protein